MKLSAPAGVLLCTLLFSVPVFGQDIWHPRTSLLLSVNYSQLREQNINSLVFSGPGVGGSLCRRKDADFFYHYIEASAYAVLPASTESKKTKSLMGTGSLKYAFMLKQVFGSEKVSAGVFGQVSVKESYFTKSGSSTLYWANFAGLGGALSVQEPLSARYAFEALLEIPLAGANFRRRTHGTRYPKNTIVNVIKFNTSNGNFALPGNYLNPSLTLSLLSSGPSFLRGISYKYMHYEVKTAVSNLYWENSHALMFTFSLGNPSRG